MCICVCVHKQGKQIGEEFIEFPFYYGTVSIEN